MNHVLRFKMRVMHGVVVLLKQTGDKSEYEDGSHRCPNYDRNFHNLQNLYL
ncbi:MAG: hypothetical protein K2H15_05565 [Muribaculaceae bacterium]|nr:hypothetical protein [Muribaculaceae bacterium]